MKVFTIILFNLVCFSLSEFFPQFCNEKSRTAKCPRRYVGVCGIFYEHIQCDDPPCRVSSLNACTACWNRNVSFVMRGECHIRQRRTVHPIVAYALPYSCQAEDRNKDCSQSTDNLLVCANKASCTDLSCKFKAKKCDACTVPDVDVLTDSSTCFDSFLSARAILVTLVILVLTLI